MCKLTFRGWIANAAARFSGSRGSVTKQAQQANCSRQTVYDHAQKVEAAVETAIVRVISRPLLVLTKLTDTPWIRSWGAMRCGSLPDFRPGSRGGSS